MIEFEQEASSTLAEDPIMSVAGPTGLRTVRPSRDRLQLWTPHDIRHQPDPTYLIDGILPDGTLAAIYSAPASFKTFIALDMAFSVCTGVPWAGHAVRAGLVAYIAGEGSAGLKHRLAGWEEAHGVEVTNARFATRPVALLDAGQVDELIEGLQALSEPAALVIFDTLARSFGMGDENATQDMNRVIASLDRIRDAIGCTVLVIHHTPFKGGKLRGSSALPGALDTIIAVGREDRSVVLRCEKQKDAPEFGPIRLVASPVELPDGASSLVLLPAGDGLSNDAVRSTEDDGEPALVEREHTLLELLSEFGSEGASAGKWQEAGALAGVPRSSFFRALKDLIADGHIEKFDSSGQPRYRVIE